MNKTLFLLLTLICSMNLFYACSDDDSPQKTDKTITGVYKGELDIKATLPQGSEVNDKVPQKLHITETDDNKIKLELKNFQFGGMPVGDITVEDIQIRKEKNKYIFSSNTKGTLGIGICDLDIKGTIEDEEASITIGVDVIDGLVKGTKVLVDFSGSKLEVDQNSEAKILEFVFNSKHVTTQPVIDGENIVFYVTDTISAEILSSLIPTITISEKATISPKSGEKQDFSKSVTYKVTSEDGITSTVYTVSIGGKSREYDFEEWKVGNEGQEPENTFYEVAGGWSSSNAGAFLLKMMFQMTDRVTVTKSNDAHSGKSAARIETLDTQGKDLGFVKVPKVTTGTLFLGEFKPDINNTLASPKFGIPFYTKPIALKGYYKYTPGEKYYASSTANPHKFKMIEDKKDECVINAIVYEVSTFDDKDFNEYLTGADAYNSDRLVAMAQLKDGSAKAEYTPFEIEFDYKKEYDPAKKYRMSIICSSSKNGDSFSGAPGSVLLVDDFLLVSE